MEGENRLVYEFAQCRELDRIDKEPMELEWKMFPGFITTLHIVAEIQNMMTEIHCEPEQFPGRIIFMSMYNKIVWWEKGNEDLCIANSKLVPEYARKLAHGHWSFLGLGSEKKWYGTHTYKPNGKLDRVAEDMMLNFSESGHPVFRGSSALERGNLKKQRKREIVYTFLWWRGHSRIGSSHKHFRQSAQYLRSSRRSMQRTRSRFKKSNWPTELSTTNKTPRTNDTVQGNLLHDYEQKFAILPDHLRLIKLCSNVGITKTVTKTVFWRPSTMRNWTNWEAHVESVLFLETTQLGTRRSVQLWRWLSFTIRAVTEWRSFLAMELVPGWWSWMEETNTWRKWWRKPKRTTSMTLETGKLVANARPKQTSMPTSLLQRLRHHITSVSGSTSNQVSDSFDTILQYVEKKTEQSNSESWHRFFVQNLRLLSIGNSNMAELLAEKEEVLKRDFSIVWIHTLLTPSCTFEQFKATLEEHTLVLHCRTTCCYRATSPSTSTTLEAPTTRTRSFNPDWFQVAKEVKKGRHAVFFTAVNPMFIDYYRERDYDVTKPRILQRTNTIGKCTKTQCIGVIWGLLRVKDCSSIKRDQTRSSFTTFYLRCVSRGWWSGSQEKNCTAKRISLLLYRKELYWSRTCIMNARTPQALTRERPSTIPACPERIVTVERTSKVVAAK